MRLDLSRAGADILSKALSSLYRIHEYVSILATPGGLEISTASVSRSTFAALRFSKDSFLKYEYYQSHVAPSSKAAYQISLALFLTALRSGAYIQDSISNYNIDFSHAESTVVSVIYECGVKKKFFIPHNRGEPIKAAYNLKELRNSWEISSLLCRGWFRDFHQKLEEISIISKKDSFILKSFYEPEEGDESGSIVSRNLFTKFQMNVSDFDDYRIVIESELTVNLKHLKTLFYFADSVRGTVKAMFEESGSPIVFSVSSLTGNVFAEFALATLINPIDVYEPILAPSQPVIEETDSIEQLLQSASNHSILPHKLFFDTSPPLPPLNPSYSKTPSKPLSTAVSDSWDDEEILPSPDANFNSTPDHNLPKFSFSAFSRTHSSALIDDFNTDKRDRTPSPNTHCDTFPGTVSTHIQSSLPSSTSSPPTPTLPTKRRRSSSFSFKNVH